ncbi:MAG TPA: flagellar motor switch phosphatase FliY [Clostridiales bacterium]|nr:MAG: flagellar motor switch protein FliN [Clostridiales bacterium GWD2_32_19]HCC08303.1 flagellar motor switch phosphatase FliY [Clostridiales bacterium]
MADMLSQDEIDALLGGDSNKSASQASLSNKDKDEVVKLLDKAMGKASEVLSNLINKHVTLKYDSIDDESAISSILEDQAQLATKIEYKQGIKGESILLLKMDDAKVIAGLMMGTEAINDEEFSDLHLSAITEAISQMIGAQVTIISSILGGKIDVNSPKTEKVSSTLELEKMIDMSDEIILINYYFLVDDLITSEIRLIVTETLAESILSKIKNTEVEKNQNQNQNKDNTANINTNTNTATEQDKRATTSVASEKSNVNVKPVQFSDMHSSIMQKQKENIELIMDVPLEVTVELGRTHKSIKDILEFAPGTIIELDKIAGDPIDILVNGKFVAKGEVIVIDENFGIRITEIIDVKERI